jgi:hypothetical protein
MRHRLAAFVALAVVLTGCGSGSTGAGSTSTGSTTTATTTTAAAGAANDETVAWMDQVCGASLGSVRALTAQPQLDSKNPAGMQRQFADWLGSGSTAIGQTMKDLEPLKVGPHPDSAKLVGAAVENFGKVKAVLDKAKTTVEAANPNDVSAIVTAVTQVATDLAAAAKTGEDFTEVFVRANLGDAQKKAPNCQAIEAGGVAPTK